MPEFCALETKDRAMNRETASDVARSRRRTLGISTKFQSIEFCESYALAQKTASKEFFEISKCGFCV
jgi:hypothetical protein